MTANETTMAGLTTTEAKKRQETYGRNELTPQVKESFLKKILEIICEPMFLLLIVAAVVYFLLGEPRDGAIMLIFVIGIIGIDVVQEWKTDKTLNALKSLSAPRITVIRDGKEQEIESADLVPGDLMLICEGVKIPADGKVIRCSDLCVDESSLTGEAEGVWKVTADDAPPSPDYWRTDYCYAGTLVTQGTATILVEQIGTATEYGKIGAGIATVEADDTPLQKQTGSLVKVCAVIAGVLFLLVAFFTWLNLSDLATKERLIASILSGVTLAMAMIPEEFPVILTVFLSMGAWRLAKKNALVRKLPSVETLGAVSVLCVDKTGTITMNRMTLQETRVLSGEEQTLLTTMGLGCEPDPYDPMEKAMLRCCEEHGIAKETLFSGELFYEYAFTNELKMMGHVWKKEDCFTIAAKGSPEMILTICDLDAAGKQAALKQIQELSSQGLRVIAVACGHAADEASVPAQLTDCHLTLLGLVGLADPPREGVKDDISLCNKAGVRVVMITGDNGSTASAIAKKVGIPNAEHVITGEQLERMSEEELREAVRNVSIFSRVIPEHKMRIVHAFQANGEIVAMTGDGVNDAPALKAADIGIAMGKRGSEVSREASNLILMDDDFTTIVDTVRDGRRIYDNIRKAVGYIFTIHIPIAASSLLGPFLGIDPASLFLLPLHVVLLEILIDPTCSIVLERQPAESDIMDRKPRNPKEPLLTMPLFVRSILQGITIFLASFGAYYLTLTKDPTHVALARTLGLTVIILSNILLVQVNSSDHDPAIVSLKKFAKDPVMWLINGGTLVMLVLILYTPLSGLLKLTALSVSQMLMAVGLACAAVLWFEIVKLLKKSSGRLDD